MHFSYKRNNRPSLRPLTSTSSGSNARPSRAAVGPVGALPEYWILKMQHTLIYVFKGGVGR